MLWFFRFLVIFLKTFLDKKVSPAPTPVSPWITVLPEYNRAASVTAMVFDMEVNMVADKEVHTMMNEVTKNVKDIVGEEN